jgi:hypothetical protein
MHVPELIRLCGHIQIFTTDIAHPTNKLGFGVNAQTAQLVMGWSVSHEKQNWEQHSK